MAEFDHAAFAQQNVANHLNRRRQSDAKFAAPEAAVTTLGVGAILGGPAGIVAGLAQGILGKRLRQSQLDAIADEQSAYDDVDGAVRETIDRQMLEASNPQDVEQLNTLATQQAAARRMLASNVPEIKQQGAALQSQIFAEQRAYAVRQEEQAIAADTRNEAGRIAMGEEAWDRFNTVADDLHRESAPFIEQRDAYGRLLASAANPSAAGDLSLIIGYMKILDPGSIVREGEFATAANSGGVDQRVRALYNSLLTGERLTPEQRADFVRQAGGIYKQAASDQTARNTRYIERARAGGVPENYLDTLAVPTGMKALAGTLPASSAPSASTGQSETPAAAELEEVDGGAAGFISEGLSGTVDFIDDVTAAARRKREGIRRVRDPNTGQIYDVAPDGTRKEISPGTVVNGQRLQTNDAGELEWVPVDGSGPPRLAAGTPGAVAPNRKTFKNTTGEWERIDYPDGSFQWVRKDERPTND